MAECIRIMFVRLTRIRTNVMGRTDSGSNSINCNGSMKQQDSSRFIGSERWKRSMRRGQTIVNSHHIVDERECFCLHTALIIMQRKRLSQLIRHFLPCVVASL